MSTEVETSLDISDRKQSEIELVRLPTLSPLPSRHNCPCRSSRSLHSSTSLGMTKRQNRLRLGSTGCQPVHLGSLPRCICQLSTRTGMLPASCRQLQASRLCFPDTAIPTT